MRAFSRFVLSSIVFAVAAFGAVSQAGAAEPERWGEEVAWRAPEGTGYYQPRSVRSDLSTPSRKKWKKAWIAAWVAFAVVNALDTHSSLGRAERNPLLRNGDGRFSAGKATVLKSAIGGGFFALQWWIGRRNPRGNYYKTFTIATGAATAALGGVAIHNYGLRESAATQAAAPAYLLREAAAESE